MYRLAGRNWMVPEELNVPTDRPLAEIISQGRSGGGVVTWLPQAHQVSGIHGPVADQVAVYQAKILEYLLDKRPQHVFCEGLASKYLAGTTRPGEEHFEAAFDALFHEKKVPAALSIYHRDALVTVGAARIYATLAGQGVRLLPTDTVAAYEDRSKRAQNAKSTKEREAIILDEREAAAGAAISEYLRTNPSALKEGVVVIYGEGHSIGPEDFPRGFSAGITICKFPSLYNQGILADNKKLLELKNAGNDRAVTALAEKMTCLYPFGWACIGTPNAQARAYERLYFQRDEDAASTVKFLIENCLDEKFKTRIQKDYQTHTGPFAQIESSREGGAYP